tara:strand:- start:22805 stop:25108 length:2304 start_codon:yes stop_codon:yes gene_type:complete
MKKNLLGLLILLAILSSIPFILDTITQNESTYDLKSYIGNVNNSSCEHRYREVESNILSLFPEASIERVAQDIYVIPEYQNIKCLGKVVKIVSAIEKNEISIVIGTNEKVFNYVNIGSYFLLFLVFSVISKKNFPIYFIILQTILFNINTYLNFDSYFFSLFLYTTLFVSIIYFFKYFEDNDNFLFFSPIVLIPAFYIIHFSLIDVKIPIKNQILLTVFLFLLVIVFINFQNKNIFTYPLLILTSFIMNYLSFTKPIKDVHPFKQSQTALTARTMYQDGLTFNTPLPVFGIDAKLPFEFPFLQLISATFQKVGFPEVYTLRPVSWISYLIFLCLSYRVVQLFNNKSLASTAIIFILFHPTLYHYSNSYMIEFIPHIFGLLSVIKFKENKKYLSGIFLSMCLLAKITTGIVYLFLVFILYVKRKEIKYSEFILIGSVVLIPNIIWNFFSEYIKNSNEQTAWLTSSNMIFWNFASFEDIINPSYWFNLFDFYLSTFWDTKFLFFLGILFLFFIIKNNSLVLITFIPILLFSNLYTSHYYYLIAIIPFIIYFICLMFSEKINSKKLEHSFVLLIICIASYGQIHQSITNKIHDQFSNEKLSDTLIEYNQQNVYLASYYDWNPIIFLESDKRGIMWNPRYEELGKGFDDDEFAENKIQLFVAQKGFLNKKHLYNFLDHNLSKNQVLRIDTHVEHGNMIFLSNTMNIDPGQIYISKINQYQIGLKCNSKNFKELLYIDKEYKNEILDFLLLNKDYVLISKIGDGFSKLNNHC